MFIHKRSCNQTCLIEATRTQGEKAESRSWCPQRPSLPSAFLILWVTHFFIHPNRIIDRGKNWQFTKEEIQKVHTCEKIFNSLIKRIQITKKVRHCFICQIVKNLKHGNTPCQCPGGKGTFVHCRAYKLIQAFSQGILTGCFKSLRLYSLLALKFHFQKFILR